MNSLRDKKILLVAARFFDYEEEIRLKLISIGAIVDYFDQRPSNSSLVKGIIRINKYFLSRTIKKYYNELIEKTREKSYDFILFISPEVITRDIFIDLKAAQSKAIFILYMWDSVKNKRGNIDDIMDLFDYKFSFDKEDCKVEAWNIRYRPLFFLNAYSEIKSETKRDYDLLFIGTIHSDRYSILSQLRKICKVNNLTLYYYMYFPSRLLFFLRCLIDRSLSISLFKEFKFVPLKKSEILELVEKCNVVVDIQHPKQIGLTMRTMEILGARRKLITTNHDIVNYDFFHSGNIQVIDRSNVNIDLSFFKKGIEPLDQSTYDKYSIDGWIKDLFFL